MKKMILTGLLSVSLLALTQCTKSEEEAFAPMQGSKAELQADVVSSRTIAEGLTTSWAADDAMKVWIGEGESYTNCGEFTLPEANLSTGIFTGTMPDSYDAAKSYDWYAVYPYASANYEVAGTPTLMTMLIGTNIQRQTAGYNSIAHIAGSVAPLYGVAKGVEAGARPYLQMKHLTTLVKIVVTNLDEEPLEVRDITMKAQSTKMAGRARISIKDGVPTYDPVAAAVPQAILRVTSNEETIAQNGKAEFYLALIPFTVPAEGEQVSIMVAAANNDVCTRTFTIPAYTQFKAGEMNTFNLKFEAEKIIDLDAEGTANCYIVTEGGHCTFKATVGNTADVPTGLASVNWLWMTESNLVSNLSLDNNNEIHFTAAEREGNAVIAGYDADGKIVWSWHIWLTDDPRLNLHKGSSDAYQLMDRNLGATDIFDGSAPEKWNPTGYGLFYQWGRKDPFPGPKTIGGGGRLQENAPFTNGTIAHSKNEGVAFEIVHDTTIGTTKDAAVAYTVAHPMAFIDNTNGTTYGQLAWWNSDAADYATLWSTTKTIYDPCPAGYKVPDTKTYTGMDWTHWQVETQAAGSRTIYAYGYTGGDGTVRSWYPAMSYRCATTTADNKQVSGVLSWTGIGAYYWLNEFRTKDSTNRAWVMVADKASYDNNSSPNYIKASGHNYGFTGRGYPVRCQKIQ